MSEHKTQSHHTDDYIVVDSGPTSLVSATGARERKAKGKQVIVKGPKGQNIKIFVPKPIAVEVKRAFNAGFWDAETLDSPIGTPSQQAFIAGIIQGTTSQTRVGDEIFVRSLRIRGMVQQSVSIGSDICVLQLLTDNQPTALPRVWANAYEPTVPSSMAYVNAVPCYDQRFRFRYHDRKVIASAWSATTSGSPNVIGVRAIPFEFDLKIDRRIKFNVNGNIQLGPEVVLFGWGVATSDVMKAWASYELFFTDA